MKKLLWALAAAAFLAGCAVDNGGSFESDVLGQHAPQRERTDSSGGGRDPLIDAPMRATMKCTSTELVTVLRRVKEVTFSCPDIDVSATIDEIRDAGWRVVSLDIGNDSENEEHVGFPVTITVRTLY